MKAFFKTAATLFQLGFLFFFFLGLSGCRQTSINSFRQRPHPPRIEPDYSDVVIPPNIAPLNFVIQEEGDSYFVVIHKVGIRAMFYGGIWVFISAILKRSNSQQFFPTRQQTTIV